MQWISANSYIRVTVPLSVRMPYYILYSLSTKCLTQLLYHTIHICICLDKHFSVQFYLNIYEPFLMIFSITSVNFVCFFRVWENELSNVLWTLLDFIHIVKSLVFIFRGYVFADALSFLCIFLISCLQAVSNIFSQLSQFLLNQ